VNLASDRVDAAARSSRGTGFALSIYVAVAAVLWVASWLSLRHYGVIAQGDPGVRFAGQGFLGGWVRYDGGWYVGIAAAGYSYSPGVQSSVAFFPAYPLAVRAVGEVVDNFGIAGVAVTVLSAAGAVGLYWRWLRDRLTAAAAPTALLVLLLFPYAWYLYGAVYADALFLLAALAAFTLIERDHPVLAGIAGAVATAARPVGIAVLAGLIVRLLERRRALTVPEPTAVEGHARVKAALAWARVPTRVELRRVRPGDAGVLLSLGGISAWCVYLWNRFGDPFLFSSVETYWGQPANPYTWFKITFVKYLVRGDDRVYAWGTLAQGLLAVAALLAVPRVARRFGWGYGLYVLMLVAIPVIGSKDFQGLGRYLIAAFPLFALYGEELAARPGLRRVLLPVSGVILVVMTAAFAHGIYLS